jgi:hypothetical protein
MDFITNLPNVDGYDAILTVVCTLSKMAHFIPCNSTVNSRQLAKLFLDNVYRLHGLPRFLIGDRDTRYTSHFFKNLMLELKTTLCLSTAYHPQSDGNTERCHRTIEQILRAFVHTDHYNWLSSLSLAEFAYNNNVHSSIGHSPFVANYGFDPRTPYNLIDPPIDIIPQQKDDSVLERLLTVHKLIVDQLHIAKAKQKHYADQRSTPKQFDVGERVMLSTQNLKLLNQPSKKFRSRYVGPYKIIEKISSQAFKLDLPSNMKVHPVFHISLLKEFNSLTPETEIPDNIPSSNDMIYGDDTFFVHSIINHKIANHPATYAKGPALLFRVKWEGYDSSEDSWEPYVNVKRTDCFEEYYKKSDKFRLLILSNEYKKLSSTYASRFPKTFFGNP